MGWLSGFLDQVITFFQRIWDFFAQGIYDSIRNDLVVATETSMYTALQALILLTDVGCTAARELIDNLGMPQMVHSMYAALSSPITAGLAFFGVPWTLSIIMAAMTTRFYMRFVPFIGR